MVCILVHDKNDIPPLRSCNSSSSDNWNRIDLMVIDATNIDRLIGMAFNDARVTTCDTAICTSVDERTFLSAGGSGHIVPDIMRMHFSNVRIAVDREFTILNSNLGCLGRLRKDRANISGMGGWYFPIGMLGDHGDEEIIKMIR